MNAVLPSTVLLVHNVQRPGIVRYSLPFLIREQDLGRILHTFGLGFFRVGDYLLNLELHVSLPFTCPPPATRWLQKRSGCAVDTWVTNIALVSPTANLSVDVVTLRDRLALLRENFLIGRHGRGWWLGRLMQRRCKSGILFASSQRR